MAIPVIDLFAGPGGLGEGFTSFSATGDDAAFKIAVSIEKDSIAHRTLTLRSAFRQFRRTSVPDAYYEYVRGKISFEELERTAIMREALNVAKLEARCATLGEIPESVVDRWIKSAVADSAEWVLIGGPPCQAYSLVGRSRMANLDRAEFERDKRHELYKEYLRIIRRFHPPVFVMENVKGMLSSKLRGGLVFDQIRRDLSRPEPGLEYEIRSFTQEGADGLLPTDFIIRSEEYGLPQARHRVILLGVRRDYANRAHLPLTPDRARTVECVLKGMPKIRGRLSRGDSHRAWIDVLRSTIPSVSTWEGMQRKAILASMMLAIKEARGTSDIGAAFVADRADDKSNDALRKWLSDERIGGWVGHESRSHMPSDLERYFFAACYAQETGFSPRLQEFPKSLLPDHRNVNGLLVGRRAGKAPLPFDDRFKVQIWDAPSSTVVSHIAKDGHYYVHPDPTQARSLTVREAARLQTFPDNYYFEGNRTDQFTQVGNAVPPFLARQLAAAVLELFDPSSAKPNSSDLSATKRRPRQLSLLVG